MNDKEISEVCDWFEYHAPTSAQREKLETARALFKVIGLWLVENVAASRERSVALTDLRKSAMVVNQAIIFDRSES